MISYDELFAYRVQYQDISHDEYFIIKKGYLNYRYIKLINLFI